MVDVSSLGQAHQNYRLYLHCRGCIQADPSQVVMTLDAFHLSYKRVYEGEEDLG
jgi:hypothetical protein